MNEMLLVSRCLGVMGSILYINHIWKLPGKDMVTELWLIYKLPLITYKDSHTVNKAAHYSIQILLGLTHSFVFS